MQVNSTNLIASAANATTGDSGSTLPVQTLNQDDFLKLLVAQLQAQDPLNPQTDTQFIAQMASFSSLEQSKEMQQNMASMQANDLIGRTVSLNDANNALMSGTVSGVIMQSGVPQIVVDGVPYDLSAVLGIAPAAPTTQTQGA